MIGPLHLINHLAAATGNVPGCGTGNCGTGLPAVPATSVQLNELVQIVLVVLGSVAILMLVIAGLRFITAQGNPQEVAKARNTMIYAVIGLAIIAASEAIVALVLGHI